MPASSTTIEETSLNSTNGRKPYVPRVREPYQLPAEEMLLPSPERLPQEPPTFNWASIFPPLLMVIVTVVVALASSKSAGAKMALPLTSLASLGSLGFPIVNLISSSRKKKQYKKQIEERKKNYQITLDRTRNELIGLASQQRSILDDAHPQGSKVIELARMKGMDRKLWWRRPEDSDFLGLRLGLARASASFKVVPPRTVNPDDDIYQLNIPILNEFKSVDKLPFLVDLKRVGSLGIIGTKSEFISGAARRLILDVLVHHSPLDVQFALVSTLRDGVSQWECLKWAPHTSALDSTESNRLLNFTPGRATDFLDWLAGQYKERLKAKTQSNGYDRQTALVVIFADEGNIRQSPELAPIVEKGYEVEIYTIFIGERNLPRVRCQISLDAADFRYGETWEGGYSTRGSAEYVSKEDLDTVCRALAQLEPQGAHASVELPESLRLSQALDKPGYSEESIRANWESQRPDRELLQFPIGVTAAREGLRVLNLNLLPNGRGGADNYHTILIGTTGSGKSEFLKSLVVSAALKYAPSQLNFFTMDFKGGSTFNRFINLPHMVGVVDNLGPALVERGINAIQNEIDRRSKEFARVGQATGKEVKDIWAHNLHSKQPMPHLLLLLDEFARGIKEFPQLTPILDLLVRQGRSLGMYLILANQNVDPAIENLATNVGWRIALKVGDAKELNLISKECANPRGNGQGYLRSLQGDVWKFQAGYGGRPYHAADNQQQEFVISRIEPDGSRTAIFQSGNQKTEKQMYTKDLLSEQEAYLRMIENVTQTLQISQSPRIYADPLPNDIWLGDTLETVPLYRSLTSDGYTGVQNKNLFMTAFIGSLDYPERCVQGPLSINFTESDTHLWIVGSSGSGKSLTVKSILSSLAASHTPEEVNFYIIEMGSGELTHLEQLPHTGAVVTINERERIERLIGFLDREITRRTTLDRDTTPVTGKVEQPAFCTDPHIILVINNASELAQNYPDILDRLPRLVTNGKSARIHLIITTNRGGELNRRISSLISKRFVFQLAQLDEYADVLGTRITVAPNPVQGRGYWRNGVDVAECQVAKPQFSAEGTFDAFANTLKVWANSSCNCLPYPITEMPKEILLNDYLPAGNNQISDKIYLGLDQETQQTVDFNLKESSYWVVLSPIGRGKTNVLSVMINNIARLVPEAWDLYAFCFRRNDLAPVLTPEALQMTKLIHGEDDIIRNLVALQGLIKNPREDGKRWLILLDDLPRGMLTPKIAEAVENFQKTAAETSKILIVASGLREEFQARYATSEMVKALKQNQSGIVLSTDMSDLDWLGVSASIFNQYRKTFGQMQEGDGFIIRRGKILRQLRFFISGQQA